MSTVTLVLDGFGSDLAFGLFTVCKACQVSSSSIAPHASLGVND